LLTIGWLSSSEESEQSSAKVPPKLSKDKISKGEGKGKDRFLDFVFLTKEEHSKLIAKFGESRTASLIEDLNTGIGSKGYKYKSHYFAILSWVRLEERRKKEKKPPPKPCTRCGKNGVYDYTDDTGQVYWRCEDHKQKRKPLEGIPQPQMKIVDDKKPADFDEQRNKNRRALGVK